MKRLRRLTGFLLLWKLCVGDERPSGAQVSRMNERPRCASWFHLMWATARACMTLSLNTVLPVMACLLLVVAVGAIASTLSNGSC